MKKNVSFIVDKADEFDESERKTSIGQRRLMAESILAYYVIISAALEIPKHKLHTEQSALGGTSFDVNGKDLCEDKRA